MNRKALLRICVGLACALPATASADNAAELAALMQDPMATISALETDTKVGFRAGPENDKTYKFELQSVHAIVFKEHGFSLIPRQNL